MNPTPPVPGPGSASRSMFPDLDAAYRCQLETLARVRHAVAVVATPRKRLEKRLGQLERETGKPDSGASPEIGELRHQLEDLRAEERRVTEASQRLQAKISALRAAKQAVEEAYAAVEETAKETVAQVIGHT
jgi:phage shock protein A